MQNATPYLFNILRFSRYAQRLLQSAPPLLAPLEASLESPWDEAQMGAILAIHDMADEASLKSALRALRKEVMLRLIARDLSGRADLKEVMATATLLAELSIRVAVDKLDTLLQQQYGAPTGIESGTEQKLIVVGMGKLGGGELNVSSDIDLIYIYPEDGNTTGPRIISNHEYFTHLGRRLSTVLGEITADGFVFRVDLRLRPYGDSGPLVSSFPMLEEYLITQGREWERYAWIKGRPVCGGKDAELARLVTPFVFRKYLDFGAFASMRDLHAQIRREVQRKDLHDNIKLGPGGIREIEFIAQVFQLIRGGKMPGLQAKPTLAVLSLLEQNGLLPPDAVAELINAYLFLRNLEHRLQYLDDQQTQRLPQNKDDQLVIAEAMGFDAYDGLLVKLDFHRAKVTRHFELVFAAPQREQQSHPYTGLWQGALSEEDSANLLSGAGYRDGRAIWNLLQRIRKSSRYNQMPASGRQRFDALMPPLIQVAQGLPNPDETLERVIKLLESIGRRESYLALLSEYPQTLTQVGRICSASPWAAEYLARYPILLDELLDHRRLYATPDWPLRKKQLEEQLATAQGDTERQMDIMRHFKHAQVFQLLAQDLSGQIPLETLSDHLSLLADMMLEKSLSLCWESLKRKHRDQAKFAIIAYGKLGGKELGYASDLDIIFLYEDESPEAPVVYAKLAQRLNTWISSLTAAGILYDTDLRLRPDGAAGLLVSSVEAFEEYQKHKAWVWEHQALTRARFAVGDQEVGGKFESIRREVLMQQRDTEALAGEVLAMRRKMLDAHPNASNLFDIKHDQGGIIDVEFMVQYLILAHARAHPALIRNVGNLALLSLAAEEGLIPEELAEAVRQAYRQYRLWQHSIRLQGAEYARIEPGKAAPQIGAVMNLWQFIFRET